MGLTARRDSDPWLEYNDIPDSQKTEFNSNLRFSVSKSSFISSVTLINSGPYEDRWNPDLEMVAYTYLLKGDIIDSGINTVMGLDNNNQQTFWDRDRRQVAGGVEVILLLYDHHIRQGLTPSSLVVFKNDGTTIDPNGTIRIRHTYQIFDSAGIISGNENAPETEQPHAPTPDEMATGNQEPYFGDAYFLREYNYPMESTHSFFIIGTDDGGVWGTDIYTDDSSISTAAVHAGLVQVGEAALVTIRLLPGLERYTGSTRNGVSSYNYDTWRFSFEFVPNP